MTKIIFFGPPGAGKGTQAKIISNYLELPHLSTGDILRSKIKKNDSLAIQVKEIIASGKLVSDDILNSIVSDKLQNDCKDGYILDGYPRTLEQADFLNSYIEKTSSKLDFIFNVEIDFETLKQRIIKRSLEEAREDDKISVIETRYNEYTETTKKVSDYYRENNPEIFYDLEGNDQIEKITTKITKILQNR